MGWNEITLARPHEVLAGLDGSDVYFVHSFAARFNTPTHGDIAASCDYGGALVAALARDNMIGTQFHPEKSQQAGLQLIANFLEWRP
jgi:glutamine amidotransferase